MATIKQLKKELKIKLTPVQQRSFNHWKKYELPANKIVHELMAHFTPEAKRALKNTNAWYDGPWLEHKIWELVEKTRLAFGGCVRCYGKGYGTQTATLVVHADFIGDHTSSRRAPTMVFCVCPRGRALKALLKK